MHGWRQPGRAERHRNGLGIALLIVVTAAWGSTFLLVKDAVAQMPVMSFLAFRFVVATVVLAVIRPRTLREITAERLRRGTLLGLCLAGGYIFQTLGLARTSAAVSGFITGLCVVFVPLLARPLLGHRNTGWTLAAVVIATIGLGFISLHGVVVGAGEILTLICAIFYALQIVGLGAWSNARDAYALTLIQLAVVALVCVIGSLPSGIEAPRSGLTVGAVASTAIVATAIAFVVQSWAQSFISPTRAAIIFTLEPVFAGLVAYLGGEHLGTDVLVGGGLVVVAMCLTELGPAYRRGRTSPASAAP